MKTLKYAIIFVIIFSHTIIVLKAQTPVDYAVMVTTTLHEEDPAIEISWPYDDKSLGYTVYRKLTTEDTWIEIQTFSPNSSGYTFFDENIEKGIMYEYRIIKSLPSSYNVSGLNYIVSGIEIEAIEYRGKVVLLVDSTHSDTLKDEIKLFINDLRGDGWIVLRHDVSPLESVPNIREIIRNEYTKDWENVKAAILLGNIPVPYSGHIVPDGHTNNHLGAWSADVYYGVMEEGVWSDFLVNNSSSGRQSNVPGDGKFDQSTIPADAVVAIGRIDLSKLPAFDLAESELLRNYLNKNHNFRHGHIQAERRGLIKDNFGVLGGVESFAATGWRNFSAFFGAENVTSGEYFPDMKNESYLFSYGTGGGTYTSAGGVGNTGNFASDTVQTVFTMLFGSYFGDWDVTDNFLRAPLASGTHTLTNMWSGRPVWYLHHMAAGKHIGHSVLINQNNNQTYHPLFGFQRSIHIALMGDPTLRMHIVKPASEIEITDNASEMQTVITWQASTEPDVLGYHLYHTQSLEEPFIRVNKSIIQGTDYVHGTARLGTNIYMVRAVKLENKGSASYYNLSQGIFDSVELSWGVPYNLEASLILNNFGINIYPNPANDVLNISFNSVPEGEINLTIYSITGQAIQNYVFDNDQTGEINIKTNNLNQGLYLLKVKTNHLTSVEKFIIKR